MLHCLDSLPVFVSFFPSSFLPFVGMVTILMNDYPKLKVRTISIIYTSERFLFPSFSLSLPPVCSARWSRNICAPPSGMITDCDLGNSVRYSQKSIFLSLHKFNFQQLTRYSILPAHTPHKISQHCSYTQLKENDTKLMLVVHHLT